jgi:hypothetical protein
MVDGDGGDVFYFSYNFTSPNILTLITSMFCIENRSTSIPASVDGNTVLPPFDKRCHGVTDRPTSTKGTIHVQLVQILHESHQHSSLQITREVIPTRLIFYLGHGTSPGSVRNLGSKRELQTQGELTGSELHLGGVHTKAYRHLQFSSFFSGMLLFTRYVQ